MTGTVIYYAGAAGTRRDKVIAPTPPVQELDLTWFDEFLERYVNPGQFTPNPDAGGSPTSHAEQMIVYRDGWVANTYQPFRDFVYYDPTVLGMQAYYYKIARGQGADQRWLDFAEAAGEFWHVSNVRGAYGTGTGVYHFPQGLWMCQDFGMTFPSVGVYTPELYAIDCDNAIRNFYGNTYYNGTGTNEAASRYSGRLMEWLSFYYRIVGMDDPSYKNNDVHRGVRYHTGQYWQEHHIYEWIDEWHDNPRYPGIPPYTDPIDYAVRAINPPDVNGNAIFNFGPFMCQFTYESNMQLHNEDANYKQSSRLEYVKRLVEFNYENGWFPPSGTPGAQDEHGAWGYYYTSCGTPTATSVPTAYCQQSGGQNTDWAYRLGPSLELTAFHLEALGWLWRHTGDTKYVTWFDQTWHAIRQAFQAGKFNSWFRTHALSKQLHQLTMRTFNGLVLRGAIEMKTAIYPDGWPYNTPPQVDPNP